MTIEGIAISDFKQLNDLRYKAQTDSRQALPEVSKQFEAIFLQSMLKSMRMSQHFIDDNNPLRGRHQETFQEMLDGQYVSNITSGQSIGLATMLAQQLGKTLGDAQAKTDTGAMQPISADRYITGLHPASPSTSPEKAGTIDEFVKSVWPYARQAASLIGLDPKVLMAQAALETGWGKHIIKDANGLSSNNLFNIKGAGSDQENSVEVSTTEYIANTPIKMNASFKRYATPGHSFSDYISLIKGNSRYEAALANTANPERYINELHQAGYATDPSYASKILSIYNGGELQQALERNGCV
ncbi:muramidase, peptidoglycan hydrolase FlgJ [Legionella birminghamensis]|uniref:Peptidoglycan hydrolase FlgJ n=1 Tax=Legionella birminghamensis TaxID=28083 RepID=A0A378I8L3_9GAMM|nr:flagellar assembly peptidoglycan hydrolase FlgJ [Legionella birminghamensis]KTC74686.1 muramidase, peptidoglycan hydrolase FlgJ [Legionella birminghamensis]STX31489.1 muramidase, peptidoglycan hydrolase FlgJ [Legionella birminghamensis]